MKKFILSLLITFSSLSINAQYLQIDSLYLTNNSNTTNILEVNLVVFNGESANYLGSNYEVSSNNVISLNVCYHYGVATAAEWWDTRQLYVILPNNGLYNLNVNIFDSESPNSCDYNYKTDSASLSFNFPFADTGYLALNSNPVIPTINLYPNPVQNKLNINSNGSNVDDLKIYDVFGKLVFFKAKPSELIDLSELENGIYFVVLNTEQGIVKEKLIISK